MRRCGRCEGWVAVPCMSTVSSQGMGTPRGSLTYSAVPLVLYTCIKDTPSGLRGAGYLRPQCDISLAHCCSQWNRALFLALPIRCACLIAYKEFTHPNLSLHRPGIYIYYCILYAGEQADLWLSWSGRDAIHPECAMTKRE